MSERTQDIELDETFDGPELDQGVWFPYFLPHWSSRASAAATHELTDPGLRLFIPPEQGLWCPDRHPERMRVSCIQSGSFAGPLGSGIGQQPFRDDLAVTEEQPTWWGYTPTYGVIEITMRAVVSERSMFACWLAGIEDRPERSGEICVAEIFGADVGGGIAHVGMGVHQFRDPALAEEFATEPLRIDPAADHTYAVDWRAGSLTFSVDGRTVRELDQCPDYPVQLMIGVFDFPDRGPDRGEVPEMVISRVRGRRPAAS